MKRQLKSESSVEYWRVLCLNKDYIKMTRGNQRELARAKNQKKLEQQAKKKGGGDKGTSSGKTLEDRRHRDAEAMRVKQKKAEEKKLPEGAVGGKK